MLIGLLIVVVAVAALVRLGQARTRRSAVRRGPDSPYDSGASQMLWADAGLNDQHGHHHGHGHHHHHGGGDFGGGGHHGGHHDGGSWSGGGDFGGGGGHHG
ncbi:hypothetical protein DN069_34500 [Streptacidiphilus pinicola]|uniref:Uncharacterized protein n=1 Tax=Streptacidiphilus pinicola TaxID=2219663 RepID=A0A2X0I8C5_9ACTN|nr:hypothetical protein [Streptacidiphilus pinicola]RAG81144.1 hypothetical protein DN069_34500 [Streptacidiphilus pinicola]